MNFSKWTSRPLTHEETDALVAQGLDRILRAGNVSRVFLFGSAARAQMTEASDLDFLVLAASVEELKDVRRRYFAQQNPPHWPMDVLFMTDEEYDRQKVRGGICFIAAQEGRLLIENGRRLP